MRDQRGQGMGEKEEGVSAPTVDLMETFERVCVEMGKPFARRYRWRRAEADATVALMCDSFADSVQELADLIEAEDWDTLVALARQEQTRRMIRGVV